MLEIWLDAWVEKIPWRRAWLPTPVFFKENSQGQRSLMGYSPWGLKESDTTKYSTAQSWLEEVSKSCALKKGQFVIGQENKRYSNLNIDLQCKQKDMKMDQFSSFTQSCPTLCDPMNSSAPSLPVHHQLPESTQTHVH